MALYNWAITTDGKEKGKARGQISYAALAAVAALGLACSLGVGASPVMVTQAQAQEAAEQSVEISLADVAPQLGTVSYALAYDGYTSYPVFSSDTAAPGVDAVNQLVAARLAGSGIDVYSLGGYRTSTISVTHYQSGYVCIAQTLTESFGGPSPDTQVSGACYDLSAGTQVSVATALGLDEAQLQAQVSSAIYAAGADGDSWVQTHMADPAQELESFIVCDDGIYAELSPFETTSMMAAGNYQSVYVMGLDGSVDRAGEVTIGAPQASLPEGVLSSAGDDLAAANAQGVSDAAAEVTTYDIGDLSIEAAYLARIQALEAVYGEPVLSATQYQGVVVTDGLALAELHNYGGSAPQQLVVAYRKDAANDPASAMTANEDLPTPDDYTLEIWDVIDGVLTRIYSGPAQYSNAAWPAINEVVAGDGTAYFLGTEYVDQYGGGEAALYQQPVDGQLQTIHSAVRMFYGDQSIGMIDGQEVDSASAAAFSDGMGEGTYYELVKMPPSSDYVSATSDSVAATLQTVVDLTEVANAAGEDVSGLIAQIETQDAASMPESAPGVEITQTAENVIVPTDETSGHIQMDNYAFDIPAYWYGRVEVVIDPDDAGKATVYVAGSREAALVNYTETRSLEETISAANAGGDISGGTIATIDTGLGDGSCVIVSAPNQYYDAYQWFANGYGNDYASEPWASAVDLYTGGTRDVQADIAAGLMPGRDGYLGNEWISQEAQATVVVNLGDDYTSSGEQIVNLGTY